MTDNKVKITIDGVVHSVDKNKMLIEIGIRWHGGKHSIFII